jgi:hypothetical protein
LLKQKKYCCFIRALSVRRAEPRDVVSEGIFFTLGLRSANFKLTAYNLEQSDSEQTLASFR